MTNFYLFQVVLVIIALGFIFIPLIKYQQRVSKTNVSAQWFLDRQNELKSELESGRYDQTAYDEALVELKLTAKQELAQPNENADLKTGNLGRPALIVIAVVFVASLVFYWQKGQYGQLQSWQASMAKLPELSQKVINDSDQQVSAQELAEFALALRTKLAEKDEQVGWMILGRVLMALQDVDGAISAFEKSKEMAPYNVSNNLSYAQALQARGEEFELRQSLKVLQQVLMSEPSNEMGQILIAEAYMQLKDFKQSLAIFNSILKWLPDADPRKQAIVARVSFLTEQLGQVQAANQINVQLELAQGLSDNLSVFKYVFVFAKTDQMPMPIAVKKLPINDWQQTISLSDKDLMLPESKLSDFTNVTVFARLSVDEQAAFSQNEWQGLVENVTTSGVSSIKIKIDKAFK